MLVWSGHSCPLPLILILILFVILILILFLILIWKATLLAAAESTKIFSNVFSRRGKLKHLNEQKKCHVAFDFVPPQVVSLDVKKKRVILRR